MKTKDRIKKLKIKCFLELGAVLDVIGKWDKEIGDKRGYSHAIGNMGIVYGITGKYNKAMECCKIQKKISKEIGDRKGYSISIGSIGNISYLEGNYDKAIKCYEILKEVCNEIGDKRGYTIAIVNMGNVYLDKGSYNKAMECYEEAIEKHKKIGFKYGLTNLFEGKANCLFEQKQFAQAKKFADECVELSTELSKPDTIFSGKVLQAKIAFALGKQKQVISMLLEMLAKAKDNSQKATLHYELYQMETGERKEEISQKALELYQKLYENLPKFQYKKRIEELKNNKFP